MSEENGSSGVAGRKSYTASNYSAGLCSCLAIFFTLSALLSGFMVWGVEPGVTVGAGVFVASRFSMSFSTGRGTLIIRDSISFAQLDDSVCSTDLVNVTVAGEQLEVNNFEEWSHEFGFCNEPNGEVQTPREVKIMQSFGILVVLLAFSSMALSCGAGSFRNRSKALNCSAFVSFLGMIFAIVSFSAIASWNFFQDLRNGSGVVIMEAFDFESQSTIFVGVPNDVVFDFGPNFIGLIASSAFLLLATLSSTSKKKEPTLDEDDLADLSAKKDLDLVAV